VQGSREKQAKLMLKNAIKMCNPTTPKAERQHRDTGQRLSGSREARRRDSAGKGNTATNLQHNKKDSEGHKKKRCSGAA